MDLLGLPQLSEAQLSRTGSISSAVSSLSDVDSHGYQTDFTSPPSSDSGPEDCDIDEVDNFRDREYPQLKGKVYLDHGGTTLYAKSLVEQFATDLVSNLYGNPHSASTPSALAGHRVDAIRERALRFFNADPEHWDLVFTANATASIKLVIECFRDHAAASNTPVWYGYHRDSHTSVVGARELAKMHRCFNNDNEVDNWIISGGLGGPRARQLGLFAYPGQSNMTGRRLPVTWPAKIREKINKASTYTLLDAAALASTAPLDLSNTATAPDFVALSFYKIFGFPNIGALLVQKRSQHVLDDRRYFGGGTVDMIITLNDSWHAKKDASLHDRLEDGTLPFHNIFALDHAMDVHQRLYGPNPMKFISMHTAHLGKQLYDGLTSLHHSNGRPMVRVYKDPEAIYGDPTLQGATVALNVLRPDGSLVGYADVEEAADGHDIYVRSGSLCNPGGFAHYLEWSPPDMKAAYAAGHRCSDPTQLMMGKATGVVRVSLGAMSLLSDVHAFVEFVRETYLDVESEARVAEAMPLASHAAHQRKIVRSTSGKSTPAKQSHKPAHTSHTSHKDQQRPQSGHASLAPSTTSATAAWEAGQTALPSTQPSRATSRADLSSPAIEHSFSAKLTKKVHAAQQQNVAKIVTQGFPGKAFSGDASYTSVEVRMDEVSKHLPAGERYGYKHGSVKGSKLGRGISSFLGRKGHDA